MAQQYGYDFIPAQTSYQAFVEIVRPDILGCTETKLGTYARSASSHIFHMLSLQAYKGRNYGIRWGVSLSYVPNNWDEKLRWHKTLKSCRYDLFEEPATYPPLLKSGIEDFYAPTIFGEACFRSELTRIWTGISPTIKQWFITTSSLQQVLQRAEEQMRRKWDLRHYPDPAVVYLLTMAILGDPVTALSKLPAHSEDLDGEYRNTEQLKKAIQFVAQMEQ
jgi:hypothetical protein